MTKYHCWPKYVTIYHCFEINWRYTTFLELKFLKLEFGTLLEFQELEFH